MYIYICFQFVSKLDLYTSPNNHIMLALSPPTFSTVGWPLEDPKSHDQNYFYRDRFTDQIAESFLHILPSQLPQVELARSTPSTTVSREYSGGSTMVKKLHHNASERDRRKKINSLYSSLRSLLPADQMVRTMKFIKATLDA